ncbi:palmitoyltransferase ZDHHC18-A isoform X2 [Astyanax mexicanus]|uniref:palmitoyltransferase ZDHHC18-A isoform X2 n=1 Tax=Astyanax mexicanus TaxID=7994 RepID=UPI0020CB1809|nr:palmitoyltransferase ZDHHC18-A isoform X2 [Astyanax mexicanus]
MLYIDNHAELDIRVIVRFAAFTRGLSLILQVLTRFLAASSPVVYWVSAHFLLSSEPSLRENKSFDHGQRLDTLKQGFVGCFLMCMNNPVTQLLMHWRTRSLSTRCILGYFISYWLIGLALHCNFLPWT